MDEELQQNTGLDDTASSTSDQNTSCAKCEEYKLGWQRAQADYQNLLKETARQKANGCR